MRVKLTSVHSKYEIPKHLWFIINSFIFTPLVIFFNLKETKNKKSRSVNQCVSLFAQQIKILTKYFIVALLLCLIMDFSNCSAVFKSSEFKCRHQISRMRKLLISFCSNLPNWSKASESATCLWVCWLQSFCTASDLWPLTWSLFIKYCLSWDNPVCSMRKCLCLTSRGQHNTI